MQTKLTLPARDCGGLVKVIACIEDPVVIKKVLSQFMRKAKAKDPKPVPESRAPPAGLQTACSTDAPKGRLFNPRCYGG